MRMTLRLSALSFKHRNSFTVPPHEFAGQLTNETIKALNANRSSDMKRFSSSSSSDGDIWLRLVGLTAAVFIVMTIVSLTT